MENEEFILQLLRDEKVLKKNLIKGNKKVIDAIFFNRESSIYEYLSETIKCKFKGIKDADIDKYIKDFWEAISCEKCEVLKDFDFATSFHAWIESEANSYYTYRKEYKSDKYYLYYWRVKKILQGDEAEIKRLMECCFKIAIKFTQTKELAQDVLSLILLHFLKDEWKVLKSFRYDSKLETWLYTIVKNMCIKENIKIEKYTSHIIAGEEEFINKQIRESESDVAFNNKYFILLSSLIRTNLIDSDKNPKRKRVKELYVEGILAGKPYLTADIIEIMESEGMSVTVEYVNTNKHRFKEDAKKFEREYKKNRIKN